MFQNKCPKGLHAFKLIFIMETQVVFIFGKAAQFFQVHMIFLTKFKSEIGHQTSVNNLRAYHYLKIIQDLQIY